MSLLSQARLRPTRKKVAKHLRQFISFRLRQEWFALPIEAVERITFMGEVYGNSPEAGLGLTLYKGEQLLLVDVGHYLFGEEPSRSQLPAEQFLLIMLDVQKHQFVGIPIDSPPVLKKILPESIESLPERYQSDGKIRCVSSATVQSDDRSLLFLLDSTRLFTALSKTMSA